MPKRDLHVARDGRRPVRFHHFDIRLDQPLYLEPNDEIIQVRYEPSRTSDLGRWHVTVAEWGTPLDIDGDRGAE